WPAGIVQEPASIPRQPRTDDGRGPRGGYSLRATRTRRASALLMIAIWRLNVEEAAQARELRHRHAIALAQARKARAARRHFHSRQTAVPGSDEPEPGTWAQSPLTRWR